MAAVPMEYGMLFAAALFALGLVGLLVRRNLLFMLMNIEIMLNAAAVAFVVGGVRWGEGDGQVMFILILTLAAAEVAIGLALVMQVHRRRGSVDADGVSGMRG